MSAGDLASPLAELVLFPRLRAFGPCPDGNAGRDAWPMPDSTGQAIGVVLIFETTLAFIVSCADHAGEGEEQPRRPLFNQFVRSIFWMITLTRWFTRRNMTKLGRFATIVWLGVTGGWLVTLIYDRAPSLPVFLVGAESAMAFVIYCVDAMSADLHLHRLRRLGRSLVWPKPLAGYMRDRDSIRIIQASVTVWVLLTTGWLLALEADRIARPLWAPTP